MMYQYFGATKSTNPETGHVAKVGLSPEQEQTLGLQSYQEVLSQSETVQNGPEFDQVMRVVKRLIPATREGGRNFDWKVSVVKSPQQNAFCLPGGKIVVYTGILPITKTDSGLATVLGHEMAHATSHHGGQRLLRSEMVQTAMMGTAASLSLSDTDPRKRQAIMGALGAGAQFGIILPFSREHESEADEIGILYMARAGYDPRESIQFWERMEKVGGSQPPEFMSTHPSHGTRIQQLQEFMPKALAEYNAVSDKASNSSY